MTTPPRRTRESNTRPDDLVRSTLGLLGRLAFAALVVFHAWLFWTHLVQGKAFEPQTALRWVVAVLLLVGFRALSRHGLSLFFGRRAVVLWLLVVVLHVSAIRTADTSALITGVPETVTALAQLSAVAGTLGLVLVTARAAASLQFRGRRPAFAVPVFIAGLPSSGLVFCFSPRPPPLA